MSAVLRQGCDALGCAVSYLQAARVVEIRHVVELLGVQHAEILAAVVLFLMLQFTKFTAVLLLAFLIAVCLFYMWDNIFPEVSNNQYYAYPIHMQYQYQPQPFYPPQPQYQAEPQSAHTQTSHQGSRAGSVQEPLQPFIIPPAPITSPDPPSRDQRTSALLPPFSSSDVSITRPFHPSARKTTPTTSRGSSVRTSRQEISSPHPESTSEASHQRKNSAPSTQKTGLPPSRRHSSAKRSPELRRSSALLDAGTPTAHGFSAESQELSPSGSPKREHKQRSSQQDRKSLQNRAYGEADVRALRGHSSSIYEHRIRRLSDADPQSSRRQHHSSEDRRRQLSYPNEEHKPQKHRRNPSSKSQKKLRGIEDPFEYSRMEVHDHSRRARDGPTTSTSHRHTVTPVPSSRETSRKSKSKSGKKSKTNVAQ
ncbi:serine/arginine repetitive matrix protein 2 isoform X2 [Scaptodrosophila lebanonensis]|uniref:Serine/arginine repetitive matrix protein 2 isoform X2 n=1 Tax=Drosophila lebanonensis TaxID=7225 RepID=A0A6J2T150_DROLE|nr:serine/arginine repetitive matrix protein 2 isoform X2 [Scaptodrosophila lebanonensis]